MTALQSPLDALERPTAPDDAVPFRACDDSALWVAHHEYFATRGVRAWTERDIPSLATNNFAFARQNAALLVGHVEALTSAGRVGRDDEIHVLEIGGGMGRFAAQLLRALDESLGEPGRQLGARLRYVYSDYSAKVVREASEGPDLAPLVAAGRIVPAVFDCSAPQFQSAPAEVRGRRFTAIFCNYLCCVLPGKILRTTAAGWSELAIRLHGGDGAGKPTVESRFGKPTASPPVPAARRTLVEELLADEPEATVSLPIAFLDFLDTAPLLLDHDGIVVVNDYGPASLAPLRGSRELAPTQYGATWNNGVPFAVFDFFARERGLDLVRTVGDLDSVHTAVLRWEGRFSPDFERGFHEWFVLRNAGQDLIDFVVAARRSITDRDLGRAIRFLDRAIDLDPYEAELRFTIGLACLDAGLDDAAIAFLREACALDRWDMWKADVHLGEAYMSLGRVAEAAEVFDASVRRRPRAKTWFQLGLARSALGDEDGALCACQSALQLDPDNAVIRERFEEIKNGTDGGRTELKPRAATEPSTEGDRPS